MDEDEYNIYDIVEPVSFDPVDETVDSNIVVIKEYSSRTYEKPSSIFDQKRSFQVPETNVSKNPSEVVDHKDIDSAQKDKESKIVPHSSSFYCRQVCSSVPSLSCKTHILKMYIGIGMNIEQYKIILHGSRKGLH